MKGETLYIYTRRSVANDKGNSIDYQLDGGNRIAKQLQFSAVNHLDEGEGVSGSENPYERKVSKRLIEGIESGVVKHLYFFEWTRISRNSTHSMKLRDTIRDKGVIIYQGNSSIGIDLNDPDSNFQMGLMFAFSEYEKNNMIKRIREGLHISRTKMKWSGAFLPYGYKRGEDGIVELDEDEVPVYFRMVELVKKGKSMRYIANKLNEEEVPTKSARIKTKTGVFILKNNLGEYDKVEARRRLWRDNVVRGILKNTLHKGVRIHKESGNKYPFVPLIDELEWEELQNLIEKNKVYNHSGNKKKHDYLLKNKVFHKSDGKKLLGRIKLKNTGGVIKYDEKTYYCSGKRKETRLKDECICSLPSPNLDRLENFIWNRLTKILSNSHLMKEEFKNQHVQKQAQGNEYEREKSKNVNVLAKLEKVILDMEGIVQMRLDETIPQEVFERMNNRYKEQEKVLKIQLIESEKKIATFKNPEKFKYWLYEFSKTVREWKKEEHSFKFKREKVEEFIDKIFIDYDFDSKKYSIEIQLKIPMINDKFKWVDKDNGKYKLINGDKSKKYIFDNSKNYHLSKSSDIRNSMMGIPKGASGNQSNITI